MSQYQKLKERYHSKEEDLRISHAEWKGRHPITTKTIQKAISTPGTLSHKPFNKTKPKPIRNRKLPPIRSKLWGAE